MAIPNQILAGRLWRCDQMIGVIGFAVNSLYKSFSFARHSRRRVAHFIAEDRSVLNAFSILYRCVFISGI